MNTRSASRHQKRQTRLSFQPLPSSSPAKGSYNTAIQDRLANVRYQGSRASTKRTPRREPTTENVALPTPEPSSQTQNESQVVDAPLSTSHVPSLQDESSQLTGGYEDLEQQTEDDEDDVVIPSSKRRKLSTTIHSETPTRKSKRLDQALTPQSTVSLRARRNQAALASSPPIARATSIGSAETSGDEDPVLFTKGTIRRKSARSMQTDDPFVIPDENPSDDEPEPTRNTRAKRPSANKDDFVVGDNEIEYISSDADVVKPQRRHRKSKAKRSDRSYRVQAELDDDLKDLQDSDQSDAVEIGRTRGGPVTTQRDKNREHFELLRRRRAGEPIPRAAHSDVSADELDADDGADIDEVTTGSGMYASRFNNRSGRSSSQGTESHDSQKLDDLDQEDEDDFVIDDESDALADEEHEIPIEFTSFATRKPRELFVYIIQWLVKNKIAPAFTRTTGKYTISWNKVNDQMKAQAGSRLISAAWSKDFKNAILARPEMSINYIGDGTDEIFLNCDACNRTNHPARYEFKFSGQAYNKDTLEPVNENDEDDEENEADSASYDEQGHLLPSANRTYNLGSFCAANADMGHKLTHWKHHLNQSLLDYLDEQGVLSAEALVAREKLSKKQREKEAENIVNLMKETGMIDQLWRGLQDDLEDARFGMEDHVARGGKRNRNRIGKVRVNRGDGRVEEWREGGQMKLVNLSDSEGE